MVCRAEGIGRVEHHTRTGSALQKMRTARTTGVKTDYTHALPKMNDTTGTSALLRRHCDRHIAREEGGNKIQSLFQNKRHVDSRFKTSGGAADVEASTLDHESFKNRTSNL